MSINADPKNLIIDPPTLKSVDEDLEKYFTTETVLEPADDDDDVVDCTPAPISIDIADDSD